MSQHDYQIDNGPGLAVRTDINAAFAALVSVNSGPVEPATKYPGMLWLDTSVVPQGLLRQRSQGNTAWIDMQISLAGQTVNGSLSVTGAISAAASISTTSGGFNSNQNYLSSGTTVVVGPGSAGTVSFRPNGAGSATLQTTITTGLMAVGADTLTVGADYSATGANNGIRIFQGYIRSSSSVSTITAHHQFYNPSGGGSVVGQITTTNATTAYATSSDEHLKNFIGPYDPLSAIEIIRADPVRDFTWKADDTYAVGWGAQTSYSVSQDLAVPPVPRSPEEMQTEGAGNDPKEPGYLPWGMDYSKRTPYLWAALSWALDRIDDLETRLAALEAA